MKMLLINAGEPIRPSSRKLIKQWVSPMVDTIKRISPLIPRGLTSRVITGFGTAEKRFPLGLGYLSAMLKDRGHSPLLLDRFADSRVWPDDVHTCDGIGIYASTPCFSDVLSIVDKLRRLNYKGSIAVGGPHASVFPNTIPDRVDYIVQGEAEYIIADLFEGVYPSGRILSCPRIENLDLLPRADYEIFLDKPRSYTNSFCFSSETPIYNMNTSRSCPLQCSFCSVRNIWGRLWRGQSAERVYDDMMYLRKEYGIAGVYFREDFFPANRKRVFELAEMLVRSRSKLIWACETRADVTADESFVELMAKSGCRGFYIGAESGSQRMLDYYNKSITVEQIMKTCANAKKYGIGVAMSLIVAHPHESIKDQIATFNLIRRAKPEVVFANPYRPEVARHGEVNFPTYPPRPIEEVHFANSTNHGQHDRASHKSESSKPLDTTIPTLG